MSQYVENTSLLQKRQRLQELILQKKALKKEPVPFPLAPAQQRIWMQELLHPGNKAYNLQYSFRLKGELDPELLAGSLGELTARHPMLRTVIVPDRERVLQKVADRLPLPLEKHDTSHLDPADRLGEAHRFMRASACAAYDFEKGPLCRFLLIRLDNRDHVFTLLVHHLIFDNWSLKVLLEDLSHFYNAFSAKRPPSLASLSGHYRDYAARGRRFLSSKTCADQLAYWKSRLAGRSATEFAADRSRPSLQTHNGAVVSFQLDHQLRRKLGRLAMVSGTSPYMLFLSAFLLFLGRQTGGDRICVGSPIANRLSRDVERLIGFFVNTIVVDADLAAAGSFSDLLKQVRKTCIEGYAAAEIPFDRVVEALVPQRELGRNPLFQINFQYETLMDLDLEGLETEHVFSQDYGVVRSDMEWGLFESNETCRGLVVYNTDLYESATVENLVGRFIDLLEAVAEAPEQSLDQLSLMGADGSHRLLSHFNQTREPLAANCLHSLFEQRVEAHPDRSALAYAEETLTYGTLNRRANRLAHFLLARGVSQETPVAIAMPRSTEMVVALMGILKAGATYVPIDPSYPHDRVSYILEDSGSRILLSQAHDDRGECSPSLRPDGAKISIIHTDKIEFGDTRQTNPPRQGSPNSLAYLIYTSGSTGRPKGVGVAHQAPINLCLAMGRLVYAPDPERCRRISVNAPLAFDASMQQICNLTQGYFLDVIPERIRMDGPALLDYLADRFIEALDCTPSHLELLLEAGWLERRGPVPKKVLCAGGAVHQRVWNLLAASQKTEFYNIYGPTETTVNASGALIREAGLTPRIGTALTNYRIYLTDPRHRRQPLGAPGEICIAGKGLARGYLGRPDLTAARFVPDPFSGREGGRLYRTGDLARLTARGDLTFLGRTDYQVKIRGYRVEPGEIEAVYREHDDIQQAAVITRPGQAGDQRILAYLVPQSQDHVSVADLNGFLASKLPHFMLPDACVFLTELPLTANGKLNQQALPEPDQEPAAVSTAHLVLSPTETMLIEIWAEVLAIDEVDPNDNFFTLGGHSLLAAKLLARIRDLFLIELPLVELFSNPTVKALAARVDLLGDGTTSPVPAISAMELPVSPPLSFAQEQLWFLNSIDPGNAVYNIPILCRMRGPLCADSLKRGLEHLMRRHETLRTSFPTVEGQPIQRVHAPFSNSLPLIDLSGLAESRRQNLLEDRAAENATFAFDFDRAPLFRVELVRLTENEHVFLMCIHHIICDALSLNIFMKELSLGYGAALLGSSPRYPTLTCQYTHYSAFARREFNQPPMQKTLAYWRQQLGGDVPLLQLPMDRPRPSIFNHRGSNLAFDFPEPLMDGLRARCEAEGVTGFMFFMAALQVLLARSSGQEEFWIGSPITNRNHVELEGQIGLFFNMVVWRSRLERDPTVHDLLERVRRTTFECYDHRRLPFEKLVETLNPGRDPSHTPLFQVMFAFQNNAKASIFEDLNLPQIHTEEIRVENGTAKLDLTFDFHMSPRKTSGRIEFNTEIFERETIVRLRRQLFLLMNDMIAHPQRRISRLRFLPEDHHRSVIEEHNRTETPYTTDRCMHQLFEARAAAAPQRTALHHGDVSMSYGALNERANRLAHYLAARGARPGDRVGVCCFRNFDMVVAVLAVQKLGAAYVPIDPAYPDERIRFILADIGAPLFVTHAALLERLETVPDAPAVVLDREWADIEGYPAHPPAVEAHPERLAYIIFTSGSTGKPKGVMVFHRPAVNLIEWVNQTFRVGPDDKLMFTTSLCFDLSVYDIFGTLAAGASLYIASEAELEDAALLAHQLNTKGITFWDSAPAALVRLVPLLPAENQGSTKLRLVFLSGDWIPLSLPPTLKKAFPRVRVIGLGGATEATIWSNFFPIGNLKPQWKSVPYGRPIQNAAYYALDRHLNPVPINTAGDLYIGGKCLAFGYFKRPGLTAERFVPDPFHKRAGSVMYKTGDQVRRFPDGVLEFLGRVDSQVKIRGFRIELGEIESALQDFPSVKEAIVVVRGNAQDEKRLIAYIRATQVEPSVAENEALRRFLGEKLPEFMIPSAFVQLTEWPLTANGKLDRKGLPEPETTTGAESYVAPRTPQEQRLAEIWQEVLDVPVIGIYDNFFDLGGDSILSIRIFSKAREAGLRVSPTDLMRKQTIGDILTSSSQGEITVETGDETVNGSLPLTPVQHWFFERQAVNPHHFNQAVMLTLKQEMDRDTLAVSLGRLVGHHDALRLRFTRREDGWHQAFGTIEECKPPIGESDLSSIEPEDRERALIRIASQQQAALNIATGPLMRAHLFYMGETTPAKLLLIIHHLVVDGVSWSILLEDLERLCLAEGGGNEQLLPSKTASYQAYAQGRVEHATDLKKQADYWLSLPREGLLVADTTGGRNRDPLDHVLELNETETAALLVQAARHRLSIRDVLLTALTRGLGPVVGGKRLLLDLEGHGRDLAATGLDLSRTIGWFTSIYPVSLSLEPATSTLAAVRRVGAQLAETPGDGSGYGRIYYLDPELGPQLAQRTRANLAFNYLGRLDRNLGQSRLFHPEPGHTGADVDPTAEGRYHLEVIAMVLHGRLIVTWRSSPHLFKRETVARWARDYFRNLNEIRADLAASAAEKSPAQNIAANTAEPQENEPPPISLAQQGLWYMDRLNPGHAFFNESLGLRLHGDLDDAALRGALRLIVRRHEVLRTRYALVGTCPRSIIADPESVSDDLPEHRDLSDLANDEKRFMIQVRQDVSRPFNLAERPPFRAVLFKLGPRDRLLVITIHHIATDGVSFGIFSGEFAAIYSAQVKGETPDLAELPMSNSELARRERVRLDAGVIDQQIGYWKKQLAGAPPLLTFGGGKPRPRIQSYRGDKILYAFDKSLTKPLQELIRGERVTPFIALLAGFFALLRWSSKREDLVIGSDVSNRSSSASQHLMGFFINQLVLRQPVTETLSFRCLLRQTRDRVYDGLAHRDVPFDKLIQALNPERNAAHAPLFQIKFSYQRLADPPQPHGLTMDRYEIRKTTSQLDLILNLGDSGEGFYCGAEFNTDVYDRVTVMGLLDDLTEVWRWTADTPDIILADLFESLNQRKRARDLRLQNQLKEGGRKRLGKTRRKAVKISQ